MKIAMLLDQQIRPQVMDEETCRLFQSAGTVVWNQTTDNNPESVRKLLEGADIAVTSWGSPALTADLLDAAPNLKLVLHAAGSVKSIITDEMTKRGIPIVSSACVLSGGVSETALGLTIAACKNFFALNQEIRQGGWSHSGITDLYNITVGIVSMGIAGSHFAELLQNFSVNVVAYDPYVSQDDMASLGVKKVTLEDLLRQSDVVSLHSPTGDSTYHMINRQTLGLMKDGAILINTARGSLIDEEALIEALEKGKLKVACLDVTDPEPPAKDSPLRSLPNCILTPHLAGQAGNGLCKIGKHCYQQMRNFLAGEPMKGQISHEMMSRIA